MKEVKTYMTAGQSQALYARFIDRVHKHEDNRKLLYNAAYVILPAIVLIGFNLMVEGTALRLLSSLLLLFVSLSSKSKTETDTRGAIIRAISDLSRVEQYEVYVRAVVDQSELGQQIADILMEEENTYDDKPSAMIRVQVMCRGTRDKEPCGNTFAALVSCPAWGHDTYYLHCPSCGCMTEATVDGSMVDDRDEIDRLVAVGVPAAPQALITDTSTMRLDSHQTRVQIIR